MDLAATRIASPYATQSEVGWLCRAISELADGKAGEAVAWACARAVRAEAGDDAYSRYAEKRARELAEATREPVPALTDAHPATRESRERFYREQAGRR
jgi:hypothetical protein